MDFFSCYNQMFHFIASLHNIYFVLLWNGVSFTSELFISHYFLFLSLSLSLSLSLPFSRQFLKYIEYFFWNLITKLEHISSSFLIFSVDSKKIIRHENTHHFVFCFQIFFECIIFTEDVRYLISTNLTGNNEIIVMKQNDIKKRRSKCVNLLIYFNIDGICAEHILLPSR